MVTHLQQVSKCCLVLLFSRCRACSQPCCGGCTLLALVKRSELLVDTIFHSFPVEFCRDPLLSLCSDPNFDCHPLQDTRVHSSCGLHEQLLLSSGSLVVDPFVERRISEMMENGFVLVVFGESSIRPFYSPLALLRWLGYQVRHQGRRLGLLVAGHQKMYFRVRREWIP